MASGLVGDFFGVPTRAVAYVARAFGFSRRRRSVTGGLNCFMRSLCRWQRAQGTSSTCSMVSSLDRLHCVSGDAPAKRLGCIQYDKKVLVGRTHASGVRAAATTLARALARQELCILWPLSSFVPRHATRQVILLLCASCCLDLNLFKSQSISRRYITKNLQKEFGFHGMQVRLTLKKSVNVYDPEGRGGSGKGRAKRKTGKRGRLLPQPPSPTRYRPGSHK